MARLTWQNVSAPDLSSSVSGIIQAGRAMQGGFTGLGDAIGGLVANQNDAASNAELARLAQVGSAEEVDAYLQGLSGRIAPNQMNEALTKAIGNLRYKAQNYDSTNLNQQSARDDIRRANDKDQFTKDKNFQTGRFNTGMAEVARLTQLGRTEDAEALTRKLLTDNPLAASDFNVGGFTTTMSGIRSDPNASKLTDTGRLVEKNQENIITKAIEGNVLDQDVRQAALQLALAEGIPQAEAIKIADLAVQRSQGLGVTNPSGTTMTPTPNPSSTVDRILSPYMEPPTSGTAIRDTSIVPDQTLGGVPVDVDTAQRVQTIIDGTPNAGFMNNPAPMTVVPTVYDVETSFNTDAVGTLGNLDLEENNLMTEYQVTGDTQVDRALELMSTGVAGSPNFKVIEDSLFENMPDEEKSQAKQLLESGVQQVARAANVSPEIARAALHASPDLTGWFGGTTIPTANINRAVEVAKNASKQGNIETYNRQAKIKKDFQTKSKELKDKENNILLQLQQIQQSPMGRSPEALQSAFDTKFKELRDVAVARNNLINDVRQKSGKERNTASVQETQADVIRAASKVPEGASAEVSKASLDNLLPDLQEAGLTKSELAQNDKAISRDIDRIKREAGKDNRILRTVTSAINNTVSDFKKNTSKAIVDSMSEDEILLEALTSPKGAVQRSGSYVWGNIKDSLPDTPEFEPYKNMTLAELRQAAPQLVELLNSSPTTQPITNKDIVDQIVSKYRK